VPKRPERRCEAVPLDLPTINRLVRPAFHGQHVTRARLIRSGRCNTNYRVFLSDQQQPVLLRIYVQDRDACAREAAVYALVRGQVPVPNVLHTGEANELGDRPYAVLSWVPGISLEQWLATASAPDGARVARQVGWAWAAMRGFQFPCAGFLDANLEPSMPWDNPASFLYGHVEEWLSHDMAGQRLGGELARAVWAIISAERHLVEAVTEYSLVHADFRPENMIVAEGRNGWGLAGIVDWEFAHCNVGLFDAGQLFRFEDELTPGFEAAFAAGVAEAGSHLPQQWRRIGRLIDFVNLVQMLNSPVDRPVWHGRLRGLVARLVATWVPYG